MSTPNDRFNEIARQGQDALAGAVRTWADSVQRLTGQWSERQAPDVSAVVDNVFDFAERLLQTQRDFTKTLLQASTSSAGSVTTATSDTLSRAAEQGAQAATTSVGTAAGAASGAANAADNAGGDDKGKRSGRTT